MCRAVSSNTCTLRAPITTAAPSAASAVALARPSPLLAARTIATLPFSPKSIEHLPIIKYEIFLLVCILGRPKTRQRDRLTDSVKDHLDGEVYTQIGGINIHNVGHHARPF